MKRLVGFISNAFFMVASAVASTPVYALSTPAVGFTGGSPYLDSRSFNLGYKFTVGANDITVDQLGYYDANQDGLIVSHDVGIFLESNQDLIVSATISNGTTSPLTGFFRYVSITPTALTANTAYSIAGVSLGNTDAYLNSPIGLSVNSAITYNVSAYAGYDTGLAFPNLTDYPSYNVFGGNFTFVTNSSPEVPFEFSPALGLGVLGGTWLVRKVRKKKSAKDYKC